MSQSANMGINEKNANENFIIWNAELLFSFPNCIIEFNSRIRVLVLLPGFWSFSQGYGVVPRVLGYL